MKQSDRTAAFMAYINSAKKRIQNDHFEEEKKVFVKAITENGSSLVAYNLFGILHEYANDQIGAAKVCQGSCSFDRTHAPDKNNPGQAVTFGGEDSLIQISERRTI